MAKEQEEKKEEKQKKEKKPKGEAGAATAAAPKKSKKGGAAAAETEAPVKTKGPVPRLRVRYREEIRPELMKARSYRNMMAVPRLEKIILNMGVGEASKNIKVLDSAIDELGKITGQKAVIRRARKAISSFKIREGMPIGASVTLRGDRMFEFLDRLISIALPRVRDFKGLSPDAFDGRGNYTLGLRDQLIFPEIDYSKVDKARGMNITMVTSARSDDEARDLLLHLGLPFRK
jgi:large subunit ribosomal protein L5